MVISPRSLSPSGSSSPSPTKRSASSTSVSSGSASGSIISGSSGGFEDGPPEARLAEVLLVGAGLPSSAMAALAPHRGRELALAHLQRPSMPIFFASLSWSRVRPPGRCPSACRRAGPRMSSTEVRERWRDSPGARPLLVDRARGDLLGPLLRAAGLLLAPLTCSYWRARFVPFLTPHGGMGPPAWLQTSPMDTRARRRNPRSALLPQKAHPRSASVARVYLARIPDPGASLDEGLPGLAGRRAEVLPILGGRLRLGLVVLDRHDGVAVAAHGRGCRRTCPRPAPARSPPPGSPRSRLAGRSRRLESSDRTRRARPSARRLGPMPGVAGA